MSHPPFAHNPHVYNGIDPDGNPTTAMVVHSHAVVSEAGSELVDLPPGNVVSIADSDALNLVGESGPEPWDLSKTLAENLVSSPEDAPVDVDGDGQTTGYEVFTKVDLVAECENRGLPTSGNKPDLVARLQAADKNLEGGV